MFKVGTVIKYYQKTGIAVVDLISDLSLDDKIRVLNNLRDSFVTTIKYIQLGTKRMNFAEKGQTVCIKFDEDVKEGSEIYRS